MAVFEEQPLTRTVNIRDAKAHLSRLVRQVAKGESFIITNAGKPWPESCLSISPKRRRGGSFL
ncbi:type II toxin-antitoxin system prevent-host-death family antitoxin [Mesorhizobium erdmanii]|uniref:type II toxin-antitoxin system Phd/YefM family antitoxin n=1 Tax=Mesorhizobium erdmanii TaxID=1777866 RepID=UPI002FF4BFEC